ncbi:zinc ribbon domain-containing protein [bacterium]|nr:zinc ribbon domain-containing protein [bacterium]MCB1222049.1 zinc ribbon domain-containing protein [bacterium]UNM07257.1 MAG: zinc ribbon domain-containing protein [Planctomycetales bacterium]
MPLYDFQCEACGKVFEVERSMTDTSTETCPKCGSKKTVKVFSSAGISFKGSGFYVTDSKPSTNGSSKPTAPSSSDSDSEG